MMHGFYLYVVDPTAKGPLCFVANCPSGGPALVDLQLTRVPEMAHNFTTNIQCAFRAQEFLKSYGLNVQIWENPR